MDQLLMFLSYGGGSSMVTYTLLNTDYFLNVTDFPDFYDSDDCHKYKYLYFCYELVLY